MKIHTTLRRDAIIAAEAEVDFGVSFLSFAREIFAGEFCPCALPVE